MTKQEFINAFKTIEGQANPLQKFITKVGIIEMIDKSTDENIDIVFNELLESITTTGVVKYENDEITIGITTELVEEPKVDEPKVDEPKVDEPKVEEPVEEPKVEEPIDEPEPTTELPETEQ